MKQLLLSITVFLGLAVVTLEAFAGFSDLVGAAGVGKVTGAVVTDPVVVERDLKEVTRTSSIAMAELALAMGLKEPADKMAKNAECIKDNSCAVKDAADVVVTSSAALNKEIEERKEKGLKLSKEATVQAQKAILPGIKSIPLWKRVVDGGTAIAKDPMMAMKAAGLIKAVPVAPDAMKGSVNLMKAAVDYLTFSGADTKALHAELDNSMKDM